MRNKSGLAIFAGSVILVAVAEAEQPTKEIQREVTEEDNQQAQQNAGLSPSQRSALEIELKKAQERAQLAEKNADLAERKLGALEAALAEKDDQLETELKKAQEKAQLAEKIADLANSQRNALEIELQKMQKRVQLAEKNVGRADPDARSKEETLAPTQPLDFSIQSGSMQSTPQEIQTGKGIWTSVEEQSSRQLVLEYSRTADSGDNAREFPRIQIPDVTQTPVPALASEISRPNGQANASPEPPIHRHDLARVIAPKIHKIRHRSAARLRFVDVKTRLIELWHQSLAQSQQSRNRTVFSESNKGER